MCTVNCLFWWMFVQYLVFKERKMEVCERLQVNVDWMYALWLETSFVQWLIVRLTDWLVSCLIDDKIVMRILCHSSFLLPNSLCLKVTMITQSGIYICVLSETSFHVHCIAITEIHETNILDTDFILNI